MLCSISVRFVVNKDVDKDTINTIVEMCKSGCDTKTISKAVGFHRKTITKYIKLNGLEPNKAKPKVKTIEKITWRSIQDRDAFIMKFYEEGLGSHTIAQMLGISKKTVLRVLENNGIKRNNHYGPHNQKAEKHKIKINELYDNGRSIESIANDFNIGRWAVRRVIVNKRTPGETMSVVNGIESKVIEMYEDGLSSYDIADELGIDNPDPITRFIKKCGKLRSKEEVRKLVSLKLSNKDYFKSRPHKQVESIIEEMGIEFDSEFSIDGWNYDIKIDDLLIEVQGNYWHRLPDRVNRDMKKAELAKDNGYRIIYIWDSQINRSKQLVKDLISYYMFNKHVDFDFKDVVISEDYEVAKDLMRFHYFGKMGNHKVSFVAMLGGVPIAACVFANPVRIEVAKKQGVKYNEILELSRFVIHPRYHKKNFASWFISRCVKRLCGIKMIVAFADSTYNHDGTIYRALNWKLDGTVPSDYWYVDGRNIIHKKTVWNAAKRLEMKEPEYVSNRKMKKVYGMPKNRYICKLM